jgi:hypothetical protein
MAYFKKRISPLIRAIFQNFGHKILNKEETVKNKKIPFLE